MNAVALDSLLPGFVTQFFACVRFAIQFNRQADRGAVEVENVGAVRVLSPELELGESSIA